MGVPERCPAGVCVCVRQCESVCALPRLSRALLPARSPLRPRAVPGASGRAPPGTDGGSGSHGRGCRVPQPGCPAAGKAGGLRGARAAPPGQLRVVPGSGRRPQWLCTITEQNGSCEL